MTDAEVAAKIREHAGLLNHFLHVANHRKLNVGLRIEVGSSVSETHYGEKARCVVQWVSKHTTEDL